MPQSQAVRVVIYLVDGNLDELLKGPEFLYQLFSLEAHGFSGKQLIHRLLTDDWAAPPLAVEITGTTPEGRVVDVRIPYT